MKHMHVCRVWHLALGSLILAVVDSAHAQFNRIGAVMTVAEAYTAAAAADLGGAANLEVDMNNACAGANAGMFNSGTGIYIEMAGYYQVTEGDPYSLHSALGALNGAWTDADNFAFTTNGAGILQCVVDGTDDAGLSYECGNLGTVSSVYGAWYVVFAHELGRNTCLEQGDDVSSSSPSFICMMLQGYCGGGNIAYFSNPSVYYQGVQLLGATTNDCGEGPLANEGNNARQFALNGLNYQGAKPVAVSSLNLYNPPLTAVHCGGAAVATLAADQRTFAADQNFSGGTPWDANGYAYAVDVSGVTSPAPPTLYQDQRYGNMSYTFNNYLPGTNYLVRLHFMEPVWTAAGQREFNVFINGQKVLANFDIFATAGAQNRAVIRQINATANGNGQLVIGFSNVVDNACVSGIEILQGGMYAPVNLSASAGVFQNTLSWNSVAGATSYNVKRSLLVNGPFTTIANPTGNNFTDTGLTAGVTYYYVVSALSNGNESFNSLEASATVKNPALTWNKTGSDTGGAQDGAGTWADQSTGGATANWWNGAGNQFWSNSGQYAASFGAKNGAAGTVTLSGGVTAAGITFNSPGSGNYTIAGGGNTLTLDGPISANVSAAISAPVALGVSPNITVASGQTLTVSGAVSGGAGLTFTGAGTTVLTGNNSYSGGTTNDSGTLQLGNGGVGGSLGSGPVVNDAVLEFNRSDNFTWALPVSDPGDAGTFLKVNSDTMTVTSSNEFAGISGTIQVNGGTLQINAPGWMQAGSAESDGEVWIAENASTAACVVNGGTLIANSWLCVGRNSASAVGTLTVNSGLVQEVGGGNIVVGSLGANGTLNVNGGVVSNAAALWLGESSGGKGTLNLNGGLVQASQVTPSPNNAGGTAVVNFNGGTLQATTNQLNFMAVNSATVQSGGAVIDDGGNVIGINQPLAAGTGGGGLTKNGSGVLSLSAASTYTGPTTVNAGTLRIADPILHFSFDNVSGSTVINDGAGGAALNGTLTGNASIVAGGRYGNALQIGAGGVNANYVAVNNAVAPLNGSGSWTVAMWMKTTVAGATLLYQGDGGWGSGNTTFYLNNGSTTGTKAGGVRWGAGWEEGSTTLNDGKWHFVALVDNAGTKSLYVDGHADALAANQWGTSAGTGGQLWIGGSADTGDGDNTMTNGLIDEVYVFSRALPLADIQSLTNNVIPLNHQVLPPTTAVTLAAAGASLDTSGFNQSIGLLSGANGSSLLLAASTNANTLTIVNASNTLFGGVISGNGSLVKNGAGQLTLAAASTYGGATTVNAGTLGFGLSNNSNLVASLQPQLWFSFDQVGGGVVTNQGSGGAALNGTLVGSNVSVVSGGRYGNALKVGSGAFSTSYVAVPNAVTLFHGATPGSAWTVALWVKTRTAGGALLYQGSGSWAGGNTSFFLTSATQATSGSFSGGHAGGVRWGGGWMGGNINVNDGNWHFIAITDNGGSKTIYVDGNPDTNFNAGQLWNIAASGNQLWIGGSADTGDGNVALNGLIDEVYVFGRAISQSEVQTIMNNQTITNNNNSGRLPATTPVTVAAGATLDLSGLPQTIASLGNAGGGGGFVTNSAASPVALVLSNNIGTATFSGVIGDTPAAPISLVKLGAFTQVLNGASTYSGGTTVGGGALLVNGTLGTNVVTVSNATLGGNGVIAGPVKVTASGTLTAGANAVGVLTISNSLVLAGNTWLKVDANLLTNDLVTGVGTVTYGGTLSVTNLEGALAAGDTFVLFSAANYTGTFTVTNLPALSSGLYWNNQLGVNGTLTVVTNPPGSAAGNAGVTLTCQANGTTLVLSWPPAEIGWQLLVQTNHLATGLSLNTNDWTRVPNSTGTNQLNVPLDPAKPVEFYRLVAP